MKSLWIAMVLMACVTAVASAQDVCAPAKVTTLHQELTGYHSYTIEWTNTGNDCTTGNATTFEVRRSTSSITDTNWQQADIVDSGTADPNDSTTCMGVTLSCPATTYYYAVFLFDAAGNRSPISNVISAAPACHTPNIEVECY